MKFKAYQPSALCNIDAYKLAHAAMYPPKTEVVYSNLTARSMKHFYEKASPTLREFLTDEVVVFYIQGFILELKELWQTSFFDRPKQEVIDEFVELTAPFAGPNGISRNLFEELHDIGYLPLEIKALPEGTLCPVQVPILTITSTRPEAFWLVNYTETWLSAALWKPMTSATTARLYRKVCEHYAKKTGGNEAFIDWQCHDFSSRGMSGMYDAASSGAGHLLSFLGSDSISSVKLLRDCYLGAETFIGGSVPASEHSVTCAGGKENEFETFRRLINQYPTGVVSLVSDTWNLWDVIGHSNSIAAKLKDSIMSRQPDANGMAKVVFRPDSGNPADIICGYKWLNEADLEKGGKYEYNWEAHDHGYEVVRLTNGTYRFLEVDYDRYDGVFESFIYGDELCESEVKGAVECLWDIFRGTTNELGYRTLDSHVGLIYGDSITPDTMINIFERLAEKKFASDNIVAGIGSFTYQYVTRDTIGAAMKATYVEVDGLAREIFKDPITGSGKKSAKGLLTVTLEAGKITLKDQATPEEENAGLLKRVFLNGALVQPTTLQNIRERLKNQ